MDFEGENLPKGIKLISPQQYFFYQLKNLATIQQFVKEITKNEMRCSNDFIMAVMGLAKEYIKRLSDESNKICLQQGKKTISGEFFYQALQAMNLQDQMEELKKIEQDVVEETQAKFHDEDHLKQLEIQQRILFENAKNENLLQFLQVQENIKDPLDKANGDNLVLQRRKLNMSVFDQQDDQE